MPADGMPHTLTFAVQDVGDSSHDSWIMISDLSMSDVNSGGGEYQAYTLNITTQELAQRAIEPLNVAINSVNTIRANLGALQNRLENTIANLQIEAENLQTAESRISDVDTAHEMSSFVRSQRLSRAAVSMLSQANSLPQMDTTLIQGGCEQLTHRFFSSII